MSSTNKTSLGLNIWEASDKPVRQDFVNDNTIIDEKITKINSNLDNVNSNLNNVNSNIVKSYNNYLDISTTTNYVNEYQGGIPISNIISAFGLSDKTILAVICRGGNLITDGVVIPKHITHNSAVTFSGTVPGVYRMQFTVIYK